MLAWTAFSLLELAFVGILFIALVIGVSFDRSSNLDAPKWWILIIGGVIGTLAFWNNWSFSGVKDAVTSWSFWTPVLYYIGLGLLYSILEFTLAVRRAARKFAGLWKSFVIRKEGTVDQFIYTYSHVHQLIQLENVNGAPDPKIDREELAASVGAWTTFWPAYFVSLIFGDLLTELFRAFSSFLVSISGRFVRMAFKDVFK